MKPCVIALLLLFTTGQTFAQTAAPADNPQGDWTPYRAIVQLNVQDGRQSWQGSATLIAVSGEYGLLLSCRHVCPKNKLPVKVLWPGYENAKTRGEVLYSMRGDDFETDLALVVAKIPPGAVPVPFGVADPENGPFRSVGYRDKGLLESVATRAYHNGELFVLNAPYLGGMSGGATFDKYGRVVAVIVGSNKHTVGYSSDGNNMRDMIELYR